MFNGLKNRIIRFLVKRTHLDCGTIYTVLWKNADEENQSFVDEIKNARIESGTFTEEEYHKWFWTSPENLDRLRKIEKMLEG